MSGRLVATATMCGGTAKFLLLVAICNGCNFVTRFCFGLLCLCRLISYDSIASFFDEKNSDNSGIFVIPSSTQRAFWMEYNCLIVL